MSRRVAFVHSNYPRVPNDHYPTIDHRTVDALLETWPIRGPLVDCCAPMGSGIVDALRARGHDARCATDAHAPLHCGWIVTNPPYSRGLVDEIAEQVLFQVTCGLAEGAAMLMRANWDMAACRARLFDPPWYAGQTRMRFRPWWSEEREKQPIHNFCWLVWTKWQGEPVIRYWPNRKNDDC